MGLLVVKISDNEEPFLVFAPPFSESNTTPAPAQSPYIIRPDGGLSSVQSETKDTPIPLNSRVNIEKVEEIGESNIIDIMMIFGPMILIGACVFGFIPLRIVLFAIPLWIIFWSPIRKIVVDLASIAASVMDFLW